jgi:hypothetical protein
MIEVRFYGLQNHVQTKLLLMFLVPLLLAPPHPQTSKLYLPLATSILLFPGAKLKV